MQTNIDIKIFVKHLVCSYVLYKDFKKELFINGHTLVGYSHFALPSFVNVFFFVLNIK